ncbi:MULTISPECIES: hypothetical protein [unclassified Sinorhizobium]|jgi:hypothetical protein|uniref:hypothetical protein n=1 Tax=unclassified Sinorhizobium TaxID=2613772 RepID=UPI0023D87A90|nr:MULTISPECIES: hypothetical protein [unclassified Sinorhizobium]WEJ13457.1 hypothetical protein N0Q90_25965 [Sinorhizobium sp. M103]WEJ18553.1 hypothetical protein N0Q91_23960 [Sinorhizobium sp. K101]WEJ39513.1 hypothetical protein N0R80_20240 [Sinorhizobium sp. C101]GCA50752.1 hypothetical protein KGO5_03200 [Sinorhizobium sp. KGO-5]
METATLYAYQISPGNDDLLYFTETLEQCQAAALEQRRDFIENDPDEGELAAMAVYRCEMKMPDQQTLLRVLNDETTLVEACVVERKLVALVTD